MAQAGAPEAPRWGVGARKAPTRAPEGGSAARRRTTARAEGEHDALDSPQAAAGGRGRSVQRWVRREEREAADGAVLAGEDPAPEGGAVGEERVVGGGVDHEPGVLPELGVELAGAPAGVAGVEPQRAQGAVELVGVVLEVEQAEVADDGDEALDDVGVAGGGGGLWGWGRRTWSGG